MMISHLKLHWLLYWCVTHAFAALYVVSVVFPESYFFFFWQGCAIWFCFHFSNLLGGKPSLHLTDQTFNFNKNRHLTNSFTWRCLKPLYCICLFFLIICSNFPNESSVVLMKYATQRKTFRMECTQIQCKDVEYRGSRITWTKYNNCENLRMWSYWNYLTYFNILTF